MISKITVVIFSCDSNNLQYELLNNVILDKGFFSVFFSLK